MPFSSVDVHWKMVGNDKIHAEDGLIVINQIKQIDTECTGS